MAWGKKPPGASLVAYFCLSSDARKDFQRGQISAQAAQWQRLVRAGVSTRKDVTFKAIGQLPQESLSQLPSMLHGYNGKPVLVTETAAFVTHPSNPEVLEVDIDVGLWAFSARQTLYSYQGVLSEHTFHCGYLVEGRADNELPERMLACFRIRGADLQAAKVLA